MVAVAALAATAPAVAAGRSDHGHLTCDQIGRQIRQPVVLTFRPAIFDRDVPTLDKARFRSGLGGTRQRVPSARQRPLAENPITGIAGCCARAASGHAPPRRRAA